MGRDSKPKPEGYGFFRIRRNKSTDDTDSEGRRRISLACTRCRSRKIRCDGATTCSKCLSAGKPCEYVAVSKEENQAARDKKAIARFQRITSMVPQHSNRPLELPGKLKRQLTSPDVDTRYSKFVVMEEPRPLTLNIQAAQSNYSSPTYTPVSPTSQAPFDAFSPYHMSAPVTPASEMPYMYYGSTSSVTTFSDYSSSTYSAGFSRPITPPPSSYADVDLSFTPASPHVASQPTFYPTYDYSPTTTTFRHPFDSSVPHVAPALEQQGWSYPASQQVAAQPSGLCLYMPDNQPYPLPAQPQVQMQMQPQMQSTVPTFHLQSPPPPKFPPAYSPRYQSLDDSAGHFRTAHAQSFMPSHSRSRSEIAIRQLPAASTQTVRMRDVNTLQYSHEPLIPQAI